MVLVLLVTGDQEGHSSKGIMLNGYLLKVTVCCLCSNVSYANVNTAVASLKYVLNFKQNITINLILLR